MASGKTISSRTRGKAQRKRRRPARRGRKAPTWRMRLWRMFRIVVVAAVLIALTPLALTLAYRPEIVRPVSMLMIADAAMLRWPERDWIDIDDVPPVLLRSIVMSEDGQFCTHHGIDWGALNSVITDVLEGERARGASTITMQTVKNLYLWNSRSFIRKGLEVPLALWFDLVVPKKRILEIYVNIAEWGDGVYGVEAASWTYFGKPAVFLTPREAALLTVALPNPRVRNPAAPGSGLSRIAGIIEQRALRFGERASCVL